MSGALRSLNVLALDGQASGATPAYGDLIELGWAVCSASGLLGPVQSRWIVPRTDRPIRRAIRELTGWTEACLSEAVDETTIWKLLRADVSQSFATEEAHAVPTVIHFARFELPFLRDLHDRLDAAAAYPFDAICVHAIAARLFPDLPRRNIRALAGFLGHSPELLRRSSGHVEATAFIWQALVPQLEAAGVVSWNDLKTWLEKRAPGPRPKSRSFPLSFERRRSLPDVAGVYRFLRKNGDVVYVGKAVSLRKRIATHFKSRGPATERGLELLSQVHDILHTETGSLLEAALLETDEIKRLDPPYNVQLRSGERSAWFASWDLSDAVPAPDDAHPFGPLPSRRALSGLCALIALAGGEHATPGLCANVLAVPPSDLPNDELFDEGFRTFASEHLLRAERTAARRVAAASRALWLARGHSELESPESELSVWDLTRVRRRLERTLVQTGLLVRRARLLGLLVDANVAFREAVAKRARALVIVGGEVRERHELSSVVEVAELPRVRPASLRARQRAFDAAMYDRLRVLVTELRRILEEGGEVALCVGPHRFAGEHAVKLLRAV